MDRRSSDEIERRIREWEQTRDRFGADGGHGVVRFINDEIDRLRYEKRSRDRPMAGGRRATDPKPPLRPPPV